MTEPLYVTQALPKPGLDVLILAGSGWMDVRHITLYGSLTCGGERDGERIKIPYWEPGGLPIGNSICWWYLDEFLAYYRHALQS